MRKVEWYGIGVWFELEVVGDIGVEGREVGMEEVWREEGWILKGREC